MEEKWVYPQEIVVWKILPLMRKELAIEMKNLGVNQTKIAGYLGVTKAAVSQYFHEKRGTKIKISKKLKEKIKESARKIVEKNEAHSEIQKLLNLKETKELLCLIHKKEFSACKKCNLCFMGENYEF